MKNLVLFMSSWGIGIGLLALVTLGISEGNFIANFPGGRVSAWLLASLILGLVSWGLDFINSSAWFRKQSFLFLNLFNIVALLVSVLCILTLIRILAVSLGFSDFKDLWQITEITFLRLHFWSLVIYVVFFQGLINFIQQMANMIGPRILKNIVFGHYRKPKTEERIFMFLDLQGSTSIAERLGHEKFCRLIQDCFSDLTQSALAHELEIYQYVGDEAILTWDLERGARNSNCLTAFYDFNDTLLKNSEHYEKHYQCVPRFKAGINVGSVAVAEIGTIKRNIAYLSDVLNTAARIESLCNKLKKPLLISEDVKTLLGDTPGYSLEFSDEIQLRGKQKKVKIYSVERQDPSKAANLSVSKGYE